MKKLVQDAGLDGRIKIDSAGIIGYHAGEKPIRVCARMRPVGDISRFGLPSGSVRKTFSTST